MRLAASLGGDSGFLYLGEISEKVGGVWPVAIRIKQHDDRVGSIFGDIDDYVLTGRIMQESGGGKGRLTNFFGEKWRSRTGRFTDKGRRVAVAVFVK